MTDKKSTVGGTGEILKSCESKLDSIQAAKEPVTVYSRDGEHFTVRIVSSDSPKTVQKQE